VQILSPGEEQCQAVLLCCLRFLLGLGAAGAAGADSSQRTVPESFKDTIKRASGMKYLDLVAFYKQPHVSS